MSTYKINLHEVIYSLSDALDLVGVTHIHHGKRVAYMAAECGKRLGWSKTELDDLFQAAILHDAGVSRTGVHAKLAQIEWEDDQEHCEVGARILGGNALLVKLADIVRYHHTHWNELQNMALPRFVKLAANCIYMVDRIDVLTEVALSAQPNILLCKDDATNAVAAQRGTWFCPDLMDAFIEISRSEAFWFRLEKEHISGYTAAWISHEPTREVDFQDLYGIVKIFSRIVDAKSHFTFEHSEGVARLARLIATFCGIPERNCELIELAALLHDLGKLRVPDEVLEKPTKLSADEYAKVQRHSFDTFNILKTIHGLKDVANWAAQHHERSDGSGYPYHLIGRKLSTEARIIAISDVFQALAENRPYRGPLAPPEILEMLRVQVTEGKLDGNLVSVVEQNLDACYRAAVAFRPSDINLGALS